MDWLISLFLVLGVLLLGAMSPGPSFLLIARTAMAVSRRDAAAAAVGLGVGGVCFTVLVLLGLTAVLQQVPVLYSVLKIAGGAYLLYLGWKLWAGAKDPVEMNVQPMRRRSLWQSFAWGFLTHVSNPKTMVVYGSVFAAALPADMPLIGYYVLTAAVFFVEVGWYFLVALVLSATSSQQLYFRWRLLLDRLAGFVMGALGTQLIGRAAVE